ncbi:aminotransferase class V-fold PLP-dependent enzyme [Segetibacter sp.]|uniref:aminotransferase class V-fold PLP-dependent enzyme n=1 Tax=Segetibacter sp. TaxID=2231182 RepID=UPI00260A81F4|nr:aminotransferase class V-fold PLP-dependent enzyme [Segetibacter sp.]MCW3079949.1 Aminotransferase, class [Segetibacter sp.]
MQAKPDWESVLKLFNYNREYVQLGASQFIVSHPEPVRTAIENFRRELDENRVLYTEEKEMGMMQRVREIAAAYFAVPNADDIAMTDSTTMGLGTIYTALNLQKGHEVLTTNHDHYSQHEAIRQATQRSGGSFRRIDLYKNLAEVTTEEIVDSVVRNISEQTRVLGITWVHSSSGLKLPVPAITKALAKINAGRDAQNKVLLLLDGVHGFGTEMETFPELGCDFFIAGCHKWIYGPRGNGLVAATREAWQLVNPVIPSFTDTMEVVIAEEERPKEMDGLQMTPGGFHALEHRWALYDAFKMHLDLGKQQVWDRVHQLNRLCKEGLADMPHVTLHTPLADEFSAGIISFEVDGYTTPETVEALLKKKVVATAAPYKTSWARFTPGIINSEEEVMKGLEAVYSLKKT